MFLKKQFKTLILKQDSLYKDIIKEKDIKIKKFNINRKDNNNRYYYAQRYYSTTN